MLIDHMWRSMIEHDDEVQGDQMEMQDSKIQDG